MADLNRDPIMLNAWLLQVLYFGEGGRYEFSEYGYITNTIYDIFSTYDQHKEWFIHVASWSMEHGLTVKDELYENTFRSFGNTTLMLGTQEVK